MRRKLIVSLTLALTLALALPAAAQIATTGIVVGTVQDVSGAVLPGVLIELAGERVMGTRTFTTNERGQYRLSSLPPGMVELTFNLEGFGTTKRTDVRVRVGATIEENVTLKVGGLAEEVVVEASAVVVDTKSTKVETTYDRDWVDNSPNQRRSFKDILISAPGIDFGDSPDRLEPASFGSNVDQNLYQLDGIDLTDHFNGNAATIVEPSIDLIEQIEVLSLGAPAEYGSHEGAVFNVVTRSGTNKFHGSAAFYYQDDGITGRNTTDEQDGGDPFTRIEFNNFTAQLGGPIVKDKLWFFAAYERLRDSSAVRRPPEAAGNVELDHYFGKLNYQITPGHQIQALVNYDDRLDNSGLFAGERPETAEGTGDKVWTPSVSYTGVVSQDTVVEAQYAGFFVDHTFGAANGGGRVIKTRFYNLATGGASGAPYSFYEYHVDRTTIQGKVSHHAADFMGASHDFKFGVQYSDAPATGEYGVNDRVYTYDYATGYGYDYQPYAYGGTVKSLGVFVDDSIQAGDRLQINAGLRYDHADTKWTPQPVLDDLSNRTSEIIPGRDVYTWNTISPRIGFNYKLTEDGKTVLKGHYGRYHRAATTGEWVGFASPTRPVTFFGDYDGATDSFINTEVAFGPSNADVDPNLKPPKTDQFILSIERELWETVNLTATYIHKRGRDMPRWTDVGATYIPIPYVDDVGPEASGQTITIFQLVGDRADRRFLVVTAEDGRADVDAFSFTATKRMADNWQLTSSLTLTKATSANTFGRTASTNWRSFGRDPNDLVNSDGRAVRERPVMAKLQLLYMGLPWGFTGGVDWTYYSGYPTRRQIRLPETGIFSRVQTEPRTDGKRFPSVNLLNVRLQKDIRLGDGGAHLRLIVNAFNLLNDDAHLDFRSDLASSPEIYHQPRDFLLPRRLMLGVKLDF